MNTTSVRERHPRLIHWAVVGFATIAGAALGFAVTLGVVVARARYGLFIFALDDLAAIRWELAPVVAGAAAGCLLAIRRPQALPWVVVCGVAGLIVGVLLGTALGSAAWEPGTGAWAGGVIGGTFGWAGGSAAGVATPRIPRNPLVAALAACAILVAAAAFALFGATTILKLDTAEFPVTAGVALPDPSGVDAVVFLLGDAGDAVEGESTLLAALRSDIERWSSALRRDSAVSVIFLGDNIYPNGLRDRGDPGFAGDSARIWSQIHLVGGDSARAHRTVGLFIAGNHDWGNQTGPAGLARVANLGQAIAAARASGHLVGLLPAAGLPGPVFRDLRRNARIAFFDTHWFLQERLQPLRTEFFARLDAILESARDRHVILVSHHPYRSAGPHGAILPAQKGGGLEYVLKKAGALVQDLESPPYEALLAGMRLTFGKRPPLLYAGGHDHSLQVFSGKDGFDPKFSIVSGAGSKVSSVAADPDLKWAASRPGYMMVVFRKDDGVDLFSVTGDPELSRCSRDAPDQDQCMTSGANAFEIAFGLTLLDAPQATGGARAIRDTSTSSTPWWTESDTMATVSDPDRPGEVLRTAPVAVPTRALLAAADSVVTTAGESYPASWLHRLLAGDLNRHLWTVTLHLPVLDLGRFGGGLKPVELTGSKQTLGMRLVTPKGIEYDFRPTVKDASSVLPGWLRRSPLRALLDDQMAAQFPFAALLVAQLLDAAGVANPAPLAVVMPNDERLGSYRSLFAGRVGLLSVNPGGPHGKEPGFAGFLEVVDTRDAIDRVTRDSLQSFDTDTYLRIRLVDFLVGDWDRHSGQWSWGRRDSGSAVRWVPIPEDRDWALARIDGLSGVLAAWIEPKYVGFSDRLPPPGRLARSAEKVDRQVLGRMTLQEMDAGARAVQQLLTDSVINDAVAALPASIATIEGPRLVADLIARRDQLSSYVGDYHAWLRLRPGSNRFSTQ